jgi:5-methylcytosine-specific restriction endonuclease McrA
MLRRSQPMKRTPVRRKGIARPVVRLPRRTSREEAKLYRELRRLVHAREDGRCAACREVTPLAEGECHHRKLRSRGGPNTAFNCVWLCGSCHRAAHMDLAGQATRDGWLVPSWADERSWPVWQERRRGWFQPTPDGWVEAVPCTAQVTHRVVSQEVTR